MVEAASTLLAGRADHAGHGLVTVSGQELFLGGVGAYAGDGGIFEHDRVRRNEDLLYGASGFGLVFQNDGLKTQLGQGMGELAAGIAFLDAAGQGGLGAHRDTGGVGGAVGARTPPAKTSLLAAESG